jgi:hypothetical protein
VNVRNDGDAPAIASTLLVSGISGADTITNEAPIGGLAPGQDAQAQVTLDALTCTPLVVTATVDSKNVVSEYAEGNNILREGF